MEEQPATETKPKEVVSDPPMPTNAPTENLHPEEWFAPDEEPAKPKDRFAQLSKTRIVIVSAVLLLGLLGGGVYALVSNKTASVKNETAQTDVTLQTTQNDEATDDSEDTQQAAEQNQDSSAETPAPTSQPSSSGTGTGTPPAANTANTYDMDYTFNGCYLPPHRNIRLGDTIRFVNKDDKNRDMWPASTKHSNNLNEAHNDYPGFDAKRAIAPGGTYSFTFTKLGSWDYHDHLKPSCGGTITVL